MGLQTGVGADTGRAGAVTFRERNDGACRYHVVPKVLGGHDGATNRQLLHPECHRQLHSRLSYKHRCVSQEAFGRLESCELETLTHGS